MLPIISVTRLLTRTTICDYSGIADSVSHTSASPTELRGEHYSHALKYKHGSLIIVIKRHVESLTSTHSMLALTTWVVYSPQRTEATSQLEMSEQHRRRTMCTCQSIDHVFIIRELGEPQPSFGRVVPRTPTTMTANCPALPTEAAIQSASTVSRTCFNVFQLGTTDDRPTQPPKPLAIDQALCRVSWAPLKFFLGNRCKVDRSDKWCQQVVRQQHNKPVYTIMHTTL